MFAPTAGGATVWPFLGVNVFPEKGSAVWWFNTKSDSVPDLETKHAACPVLLGQKWSKLKKKLCSSFFSVTNFFCFILSVGNKWISYGSQFKNRPCDLEPNTRYKGLFK